MYRKDQVDIMNYESGTMAIQAVPGAGKTFIITNLVTKLLKSDKDVLIVTYMNSGVNNFKSKIREKIKECNIHKSCDVMTIHSLALKILKQDSKSVLLCEDFKILDELQKYIILNKCIDTWKCEGGDRIFKWFVKPNENVQRYKDNLALWERDFYTLTANVIREFKIRGFDTDRIYEDENYKGIIRCIEPIYQLYKKALKREGFIDYEDILVMAMDALNTNSELREKFQNRYTHIFEDECQDSNSIQCNILKVLSEKHKNLVRVGDINQSITKTFSSSDPKYFKEFIDCADKVYQMNMSCRSCEDIIDFANEFMRFIKRDYNLESARDALYEISIEPVPKNVGYKENPIVNKYPVYMREYETFKDEMNKSINLIKEYIKKNPDKSIGILVPFNSQIIDVAEAFEKNNIQYEDISNVSRKKRLAIKNLGYMLKFVDNPLDNNSAVDAILNVYFGDELEVKMHLGNLLKGMSFLDILNIDLDNYSYSDKLKSSVSQMVQILNNINMPIEKYILYIADMLGFKEKEKSIIAYVSFYARVNKISINKMYDILLMDYNNPFSKICDVVYEIDGYSAKPAVPTICTYHKAKGLEWDCVFMLDVSKFKFPDELCQKFQGECWYLRDKYKNPLNIAKCELDNFMNDNSAHCNLEVIKERIRLLYVGITRAREFLSISCSKKNANSKAQERGIFFFNMYKSAMRKHGEKYGN